MTLLISITVPSKGKWTRHRAYSKCHDSPVFPRILFLKNIKTLALKEKCISSSEANKLLSYEDYKEENKSYT